MVRQDFLHGVQGAIDHQRVLFICAFSIANLFSDGRGCQRVLGQCGRVGFIVALGPFKCRFHRLRHLRLNGVQRLDCNAEFQQPLAQGNERIALAVFFQIIAVPFLSHATRVVPEQWNMGMDEHRFALVSHVVKCFHHRIHTRLRVCAVDFHRLDLRKRFGQGGCIVGADFRSVRGDVPFVVLDQPEDGQLAQIAHVQRFTYFALRDGRIADGTNHHGRRSFTVVRQALLFPVLHAHGHTRRRNGLHPRGTALVGYSGQSLAIE